MYDFVHDFAVKFATLCNSILRRFEDCLYFIRTNVAIYVLSLAFAITFSSSMTTENERQKKRISPNIKTTIYRADARRKSNQDDFNSSNRLRQNSAFVGVSPGQQIMRFRYLQIRTHFMIYRVRGTDLFEFAHASSVF